MNYEWTLLTCGVPDTWRKAKSVDSARRAAMEVARRWYPEATTKGYTRGWIDQEYGSMIAFGHYTVFIAIRKVSKNER